jgi:hypothetical protein
MSPVPASSPPASSPLCADLRLSSGAIQCNIIRLHQSSGFIGLTPVVPFQFIVPADPTLVSLSTFRANALRADISVVDKQIRSGVTSKRANAMDKPWGRWEHNVDPSIPTNLG